MVIMISVERYRWAVDCRRGRGSGCSRPGYGINPLGGGRHKPPPIELPELTQYWETDSGRHKQNLVPQDPGERSSDHTRDWPRIARECPGVCCGGVGWRWPAAGLGSLGAAVDAWGILKEVAIIFITSIIVCLQINNREGTQPYSSIENWIKIYWTQPH